MMSATAMIEAISNGQIGQPAPFMISNNVVPSRDDGRHFSLSNGFEQGNPGLRPKLLSEVGVSKCEIGLLTASFSLCKGENRGPVLLQKPRRFYPQNLWISLCMN